MLYTQLVTFNYLYGKCRKYSIIMKSNGLHKQLNLNVCMKKINAIEYNECNQINNPPPYLNL